ncbi:MAG: response regulator [Emcibacteraceae bacterium]|nr:response regulator [Emcibacteraceae bacterium]
MNKDTLKILLIEDDDIDIMSIKRTLKKKNIVNELVVAKDGIEALDILRGTNDVEKISPPKIILLDLNMPRMNGLEFLEEIRNDKILQSSIVFVLTTSNSDEDKCNAYKKNIAGYILKSNINNQFMEAITMLNLYWKIVEFPE